jgi:hypothetical protein
MQRCFENTNKQRGMNASTHPHTRTHTHALTHAPTDTHSEQLQRNLKEKSPNELSLDDSYFLIARFMNKRTLKHHAEAVIKENESD